MPDYRHFTLALAASIGLGFSGLAAAEWSQYRGPTHDGISGEKITFPWASSGPKVLWKAPTPNGFSSFSVSGGKAFTLVSRDGDGEAHETCIALNAATGKEMWAVDVDVAKYQGGGDSGAVGNNGGDGPRSTPVESDGKVYVTTGNLIVCCLDAETGKKVWSKDLIKEQGGHNVTWKSAGIAGDRRRIVVRRRRGQGPVVARPG